MSLDFITRVDPSVGGIFIDVTRPAYGATGDGVTDDYAAILAAITAADAMGAAVYFPHGTYKSSAMLSLSGMSDLTLFGDGTGSVFLQSGTNFRVFDCQNTARITLRGLRFKGDFDTLLATRASQGVLVTDNASSSNFCSDLTVENCFFDVLGGDAIRIGPNSRGIKIINNTMRGGLGFCEISGVDIGGDTRPVSGVLIQGNHIYGTLSGGRSGTPLTGSDDMIDCYGGTNDLEIANNFLDGMATSAATTVNNCAILLNPATGQGLIRKVNIHHNQIRRFNSTAAEVPDHSAIWLNANEVNAGLLDITVETNQIDACHYGILCGESTGLGVAIRNNTVSTSMRGIDIRNSDDVDASHNTIRFPTEMGMYLQGDRIKAPDNRIVCDSTLTVGVRTGVWSTTGDYKDLSGTWVIGAPASSYGMRIVAGLTTLLRDAFFLNNAGTGLDILSGATGTMVINPTYAGNGTNISDAGTGTIFQTWPTTAQGDMLYASAAGLLAALAKNTSATRYLSNTGSSNNPAWAQVNLSNGVTGNLQNPIFDGSAEATGPIKVKVDAPGATGTNTSIWATDDPTSAMYWQLHTIGYGGGSAASLGISSGHADDFVALQPSHAGKVLIGTTSDDSTNKLQVNGDTTVSGVYKVDGTQVVSNQGAAVADATDAASAITQLNLLLARARAHGLIST